MNGKSNLFGIFLSAFLLPTTLFLTMIASETKKLESPFQHSSHLLIPPFYPSKRPFSREARLNYLRPVHSLHLGKEKIIISSLLVCSRLFYSGKQPLPPYLLKKILSVIKKKKPPASPQRPDQNTRRKRKQRSRKRTNGRNYRKV